MKKKFSKLVGASLLCLSIALPNASFAFDASQLPELESDIRASASMYITAMELTDKTASVQRKQAAARGELEQAIADLAKVLRTETGLKEDGGQIKWNTSFFDAKVKQHDDQLKKIQAVLTGPLKSDPVVVDLLSAVAAKAQALKDYWSAGIGQINKSPNVTVVGRVDPRDWSTFEEIRKHLEHGLKTLADQTNLKYKMVPADGIQAEADDSGFFSSKTPAAQIFRRSLDVSVDAGALAQEVTVMLRAQVQTKLDETEEKLLTVSSRLGEADRYIDTLQDALFRYISTNIGHDEDDQAIYLRVKAWREAENFHRKTLSLEPSLEERSKLFEKFLQDKHQSIDDIRTQILHLESDLADMQGSFSGNLEVLREKFGEIAFLQAVESLDHQITEAKRDLADFLKTNPEAQAKELDAKAIALPVSHPERAQLASQAGGIRATFEGNKRLKQETLAKLQRLREETEESFQLDYRTQAARMEKDHEDAMASINEQLNQLDVAHRKESSYVRMLEQDIRNFLAHRIEL